jgi:hypothetical protein
MACVQIPRTQQAGQSREPTPCCIDGSATLARLVSVRADSMDEQTRHGGCESAKDANLKDDAV